MRENLMKDVEAIFNEEKKARQEYITTIMPDIKLWATKGELPHNAQPTFIQRKKKIEAEEHYKQYSLLAMTNDEYMDVIGQSYKNV